MFQDLYTIIGSSQSEGHFIHDLKLDPSHIIYRVHFPGTPITPGACQLEIIRQLAGRALGTGVKVAEVRNIKYLRIISPDANPSITVEETFSGTEVPGTFKCSAVIRDAGTVFTKASLILEPEG